MRILVVDDYSGFRQMLMKWLFRQGYDVRDLSDGEKVLDTLHEGEYDVVLLDLVMPNANGLTLIPRIRDTCPGVQVIIISAVADARVAVEAARAGAEACLTKPVDFNCLRNELTRLKRPSNLKVSGPGLAQRFDLSKV